jgi:hypothetical protein
MGIYTSCFCIPSEAARAIDLRSSRSKRLATVRGPGERRRGMMEAKAERSRVRAAILAVRYLRDSI